MDLVLFLALVHLICFHFRRFLLPSVSPYRDLENGGGVRNRLVADLMF